jgi:predicted transcriptional regulator
MYIKDEELLQRIKKKKEEDPNFYGFIIDRFGYITKQLTKEHEVISPGQKEARKKFVEMQEAHIKNIERNEKIRGKNYVKVATSINTLGLTPINFGHLAELSTYMSFQEGEQGGVRLMIGNKDMNFSDLQKKLGLKREAAEELVKKLEESGVLFVHKGTQNRYEVNPKFLHRGTDEEGIKYIKLYFKKFKELTEGITAKEKGLILMLAPYFHINQYCLCKNPLEPHEDKIEHLDLQSFATILGISYSTILRNVKTLMDAGIIAQFKTNKMTTYYMHPDVIFRKDPFYEDAEYTEGIRTLFKRNKKFKQRKGTN